MRHCREAIAGKILAGKIWRNDNHGDRSRTGYPRDEQGALSRLCQIRHRGRMEHARHLPRVVPLSIAFIAIVLSLAGKDYAAARAELGHPVVAIIMLLFILSGIFHMKLGMQSIIDDYVHDAHLKEWSLIANLFFSVCIGWLAFSRP